MYPRMAREAREEGFADIAYHFEAIGKIEKHHKERYQRLLEELEANKTFSKDESTSWKCLKCGHIHDGKEAPKVCPVCKHPQAYFEAI